MTSFRRLTIAFWGGQAIGAAGLIAGMILMVKHESFWYLFGSAMIGLITAFIFIQLIFKFVKVESCYTNMQSSMKTQRK